MSRIRTIKPEFPQSESIGRISREARLLFILLWTIVDDEGRARAASRMLASLLYPYDDDAPALIDGWLRELEVEKCIRRYEIDGSTYLEIINWRKHQKIDRPSKSRLPEFSAASQVFASPREPSRALDADLGPGPGPVPGPGPGANMVANATARAPADNLIVISELVDEDFETFRSIYPKRQGSDPGRPAKAAWDKAIRRGATAQEIIDGARYFADTNRRIAADDRRFIPRASTFLNEDRFRDRNGPITSRRGGSILDALDAIPAGYEAPPVP